MERSLSTKFFPFNKTLVFFVMVILIAHLTAYCKSKPDILEHSFLGERSRVLKNFVYEKKTVLSLITCGRHCNMDKDCKSFNFFKNSKICELNHVTQVEHPQDFYEDQGGMYFEKHEHAPLFNRNGSCKNLMQAGISSSGIYTIYPNGFTDGLKVYCDMETDGGGWIVFQRRQDGSVDFYRGWDNYETGFGNLSGEFWLGNGNLFKLTSNDSQGAWELRVDLGDWENNTAWAKYKDFKISGIKYTLIVGKYDANSTAGDALERQNGSAFTTKDNENDKWVGNCAKFFQGAWWFKDCTDSHLNGEYLPNGHHKHQLGIKWDQWLGDSVSLKQCSMKMREQD